MISLLIKMFVKDSENTSSPQVRRRYGEVCGLSGIGLNLLLFVGKLAAGAVSNSIAIIADAFNNLSDAGSSVITLIGFKLAVKKPDPDHPYGHGRMEYISGLLVSVIILLVAFELIKSSVTKIIEPQAIETSWLVIAILIVSILVKLYMFSYNRKYGKKIDSSAMIATSADSLNDVIATTAVLACTIAARYTGLLLDGWCGLLVGAFILYSGFRSAMVTIGIILGRPPEKEFIAQVEQLVLSHSEVMGLHDLIVHDYGPGRVMISLHVEVPASGDFLKLHDVIDGIEEELNEELGCQSVIHMDPVVSDDADTDEIKKIVKQILKQIDPAIKMHDFRVIKEASCRKAIFDTVVPFDFAMSDDELRARIKRDIRNEKNDCIAVVRIDKD